MREGIASLRAFRARVVEDLGIGGQNFCPFFLGTRSVPHRFDVNSQILRVWGILLTCAFVYTLDTKGPDFCAGVTDWL